MNIDFNFPVKALDGKEMIDGNGEPVIAGRVLANVLVSQTQGDVVKMYDWALALYKGESLTLDNADQQTLRRFITESASMTILLKHGLLASLDKTNGHQVNS